MPSARGVYHRGEVPMIVGYCVLTLALAERPAAVKLPCESMRLLKVRAEERAEAHGGGPVPPPGQGAALVEGASAGTLYYLTLECGGKTYVARVVGGTPGFRPDELRPGITLRLKDKGGRLFLGRAGGAAFETSVASAPASGGPRPR